MTETGHEILDRLSDENLKHMQHKETLLYLLEHFFKNYPKGGPDGVTEEQLKEMTVFRQICFLEKVLNDYHFHFKLPSGYVPDMYSLLNEINKDDFRTAEDMDDELSA